MNNSLNEFIKGNALSQNFYKNLALTAKLTQISNSHGSLLKIAGMSLGQSLVKSAENYSDLYSKNIVGFDLMSKNLAMQVNAFKIPESTLKAIAGISLIQFSLFNDLKGLSNLIVESQMSSVSKISNLQFAMSGISEQILKIATQHSNWQLINDFEEINEQAFDFANDLNTDTIFSEEENLKFQNLIDAVFDFIQKNKHLGKKAYNFLELIVLLYSVYQMYDSFQTKPEAFTKEDMVKHEKKMLKALELKFKEQKEYRITNRVSKIMIKPKTKTKLVTSLPQGFEVVVLQINHKWAFVSYINPTDKLMETGWVMKKYLDKIK